MKPLWCFVSPSGPVPSRISRVPEATKSARHCGVFRYFYQTTDTNSFLLNLFIISDSWTLAYVSAHVSRPCASKESRELRKEEYVTFLLSHCSILLY